MGPSAESFHYSRVSAEWGVLRLLASLGDAGARFAPSGAHLMVEPGPGSLDVFYAPARMSSLERRLLTHTRDHGNELLWRAVFALPLEVIEFPEALFQIVAVGGFSLELPPRACSSRSTSSPPAPSLPCAPRASAPPPPSAPVNAPWRWPPPSRSPPAPPPPSRSPQAGPAGR